MWAHRSRCPRLTRCSLRRIPPLPGVIDVGAPHPARRYLRRCHPLPGAICVGVLFLPGTICVGVVLYPALSASVLSFCPALPASVPSFTRRYLRRCPFPAGHYLCRCDPLLGAICVVFSSCPALSASVPYFYPVLAAPTLSFHLALPASVLSPYPTVSVSVSSFTQCYLCWFLLLPSALRVGTSILPGALGIGASPSYHVYRRSASAPSFITALCITSFINTFYSALLLPVPRHHFINPSTLCVDVFIIASCILVAVSRPSLLSYHTSALCACSFMHPNAHWSGFNRHIIYLGSVHPITVCTLFRSL
jgi:hypothetical protein